jgi:imidazolonepropionase-like amidohydrolase
MELMADAGIGPAAIIASATGGAAQCMGLADVGFLRVGQWADFVVVTGDPLTDVLASRTIDSVWIGGRRIDR